MRSICEMPSDDMPESIANGRYLKKGGRQCEAFIRCLPTTCPRAEWRVPIQTKSGGYIHGREP